MADRLQYQADNGVALLTLPAGVGGVSGLLDVATRSELAQALRRAEDDASISGIVLTGAGRSFPAGVPVAEIAGGEAAPSLADICLQVESCTKPVVAALRGEVRDGGLELALAARARLAVSGTRLRLGDVRMGLVPGAGGTQRLPRLIGCKTALRLMLSGRAMVAESGALRGLFRRVVGKNVVGEAVQAARDMPEETAPGTAPGFADPIAYQNELAERRLEMPDPAPPEVAALFECVEAAQLLPLEAGLAMEATLRAELRQGERAQGLIRTVTLEERQAAPVNLPDMITVQGDGPLAFGLVLSLLAKGFQVQVAEQRDGGAAILMRQLGVAFQAQAKRGRLDDGGARRMMRQVSGGESPAFLAQAGLVIEASEINEDSVPVLIKRLRRATSAETPVMITSGMALAAGDLHDHLGGRVIGLALHAAVQRVGLAELAVADPDQAALAQAVGLMRRLERRVVLCPPVNGLIAGRLKAAMLGAAEWCVKQGVAPDEVDRALGWSRGPFQQADAEGLARQVTRFAALGQSEGFGGLFEAFLSKGREGRATGRGILSYGEHGAAGDFDETARTITDQWRGGKSGDALRPESVRRRVWTALFSAGMQLLDEGVAHEAGDVDLAALEALGLPRASGGPMKAGELRGLLKIKGELERWQGDAAGLWRGSDRLSAMIKNGRGFGF